jgi:hypothetical protein
MLMLCIVIISSSLITTEKDLKELGQLPIKLQIHFEAKKQISFVW